MERDYIREFFSSEENWKQVKQICLRHFPNGYDAEDVAQDISFKLLKHNGKSNFPAEHTEQMMYITRMAMNYFVDSVEKAKKAPPMTDELFEWKMGEIEMPEMMDQWNKLNERILEMKELFTEEQLELWTLVFNRTKMKDIARILDKPAHNIATHWEKLRTKIRKYIKHSDLL